MAQFLVGQHVFICPCFERVAVYPFISFYTTCHPSPRQVSTAGRTDGLDGALLLDECGIPLEECERLDESLALALQHLVLPPEWSLTGRKVTKNTGE